MAEANRRVGEFQSLSEDERDGKVNALIDVINVHDLFMGSCERTPARIARYRAQMDAFERQLLEEAIDIARGDRARAARSIGLSLNAFEPEGPAIGHPKPAGGGAAARRVVNPRDQCRVRKSRHPGVSV